MSIVKMLQGMAVLGIMGVTLAPQMADAGLKYESGSCVKNADGSGSCSGNFLAFRNAADANTYVLFHSSASGAKMFWGSYNGVYFSCTADATAGALWSDAQAAKGYFSISWNSSGVCTSLSLNNGSLNSNF
jgi:hypothetical protein